MRFISVREFRGKSGDAWKELAKEQELVITSNGKPIAIVSAVSEETLEDSLRAFRRARAMAAVQRMQRQTAKKGLSPDDVEAEITAVRSEREKADEPVPLVTGNAKHFPEESRQGVRVVAPRFFIDQYSEAAGE